MKKHYNCIKYKEKKIKEKEIKEANSKLANELVLYLIREKMRERI